MKTLKMSLVCHRSHESVDGIKANLGLSVYHWKEVISFGHLIF